MIAISLVFSVMFFIISLIVGGVVGWIYREYVWSSQAMRMHPEMYDENGNVIPDEIIAFRFEENTEEEPDLED
jgi:hypothetical protein